MKKDEKLAITRKKLIEAACRIMDRATDSSEVTSRVISKEADVHLSMINYVFGSREALLYECFLLKQKEYIDRLTINEILIADQCPKDKLKRLHLQVSLFLINNYKFTRAITSYILLNRDLSLGLNSLSLVIEHYKGRKEVEECKLISYELSSMMQLIIYNHEELGRFMGVDLTQEKQLKHYIDMRIDLLLKEEE